MLTFNQIPIDIRTPGQYVEFDNSQAIQGLTAQPHRILVIGQRLAAGTQAANIPTRINSAAVGEQAFGRGSLLASMITALKLANPRTECWAVALDDDGAGVAATGTLTVTGPATEAGTIALCVGGVRITAGVTAADTATTIATAIAAAINAKTALPVTAGSALGVVTVTFRHKGETGNAYDLRLNYNTNERLPAGVAITIVAMANGTANPDVATALAALGGAQYNTVINPYTDASNLTKVENELATRWGPMVQLEGHAFAALRGTLGAMSAITDARNSPHQTIVCIGQSPTPPWEAAAIAGGVDAAEPDPARPRQQLVLTGIQAPAAYARLTRIERDGLLNVGGATVVVDDGGRVLVERFITTYQTNASSLPDVSYLDIETMRTLAYLRFSVRARIAQKFPRHKLADDGTQFAAGQAVATPNLIRMELLHLFREWESAGLAEGFEQFKADLVVARNETDRNRIDAILPPDVINQLRVFAGQIQFRL